MKAIDTFYNGNYYRSRLEARWSVFFDEIFVRYQYEPEGYELDNGQRYLPDFYFPQYDCFGEVKPEKIFDKRWIDFVKESKKSLIIFTGNTFGKSQTYIDYEYCEDHKFNPDHIYNSIIPFSDRCWSKYYPHFYTGGDEDWSNQGNWVNAVIKAQTKRFEHNH
jgi:hypothetical protein